MSTACFEKIDLARNQMRFYAVTVAPKPLRAMGAMIRECGRIGQAGTFRQTWFESESQGGSQKRTSEISGSCLKQNYS